MRFNEEHEAFRESVRRMVQKHVVPIVPDLEETDRFPAELVPVFGDMGLLQLWLPEEYGGPGGNLTLVCIAKEEIAKVSLAASTLCANNSISFILPILNAALPTRIFTGDSNSSSDGKGSVNRSEALVTNVAGVVTQVLPNGNLVVEGKQEVRVNFEVRELIVAGIVRPEDIESDNTIDSTKIAEARIAYGGRGQITDVQQQRYGQQVLDVLLPF